MRMSESVALLQELESLWRRHQRMMKPKRTKKATVRGDFHQQAQAKAKVEGISYGQAASALARARPDLHQAYKNRGAKAAR